MGDGRTALTARTGTGALLRVSLRLGRVSNLPTVWSDVLAAMALATGSVAGPALPALLLAMTLFYVGGMFLNDAFDRDIDAIERPERPIPSGQVSASSVFVAGFAMLGLGLALLAPFGWRAAAAGVVLGVLIVGYNLHHKANPLSPALMGLCRSFVYIATGFAVAVQPSPWLWAGAAAVFAYVIGLTYTAKGETKGSIGAWWPLTALAVPFVVALPAVRVSWISAVFMVGLLAWTWRNISLVRQRAIPKAVGGFIAGIALVDAMFLSVAGATGGAVVAVGCWALTLALHRKVAGT
jgi:hypothetical protein